LELREASDWGLGKEAEELAGRWIQVGEKIVQDGKLGLI